MTVIAIKDGVMVADADCFESGGRMPVPFPKISRAADGRCFGMAGKLSDSWRLSEWVKAGAKEDAKPNFEGQGDDIPYVLMGKPDGSAWFAKADLEFTPLPIPHALGERTASTFCEGAMHAGLSAEAALRLTIKHCVYVGGEVQVERLTCSEPGVLSSKWGWWSKDAAAG